jgi:hypothetical protein
MTLVANESAKMLDASRFHLVRVTTDDRTHQLWAAATSREEAVDRVLDAIPEGWAAHLLDDSLRPRSDSVVNMQPGEVGELCSLLDTRSRLR